jgi:GNAT superfamily N-acetyltransferase
VREATVEDASGIARVHVRTWQAAYTHVFPPEALGRLDDALPRREAGWRETIEAGSPRSHTLVATTDDEVVGFAHVMPSRDSADTARVGELAAIYVSPDVWGAGAGRALMLEALGRLAASGFDEAMLWVLEDNPRARRFYEAAGWWTDGGVKEDELLGTPVREVRYRITLSAT